MHWVDTVNVEECPVGMIIEHVVDGNVLAIANVAGEFKVTEGICPHQGGSIGKGTMHHYQTCVVRCPWHGWEYDLDTGQHQSISSVILKTYTTRVIDGLLQVGFEQ
jgi:nitrite reductase/ring-hydroxylating ferredoxin subunit